MAEKRTFLYFAVFLFIFGIFDTAYGQKRKPKVKVTPTLKSYNCAHRCTCYPNLYIITCQGGGLKSLPPELPTGDVLILNLRDNLFKTLNIDLGDWPQLHLIDLRGNLWLNCTWLAQQQWGVHVQSWCDTESKGSGDILDFLPSTTLASLPKRETIKFDNPMKYQPTRGSQQTQKPDNDVFEDYDTETDRQRPPQKTDYDDDNQVNCRLPAKPKRLGAQVRQAMKNDMKALAATKTCDKCIKAGIIGACVVLAIGVAVLLVAKVTRSCVKSYRSGRRRPRNIVIRHTNGLSGRRSTEASLFDDEEERVTNEREV